MSRISCELAPLMMIAALARLRDRRSSCLALQTFEDAKDPVAECNYREKGRRQTQKDQSRALAIIILTLFLSFFPHAPRHLACCCCPSSLSYFYESSRSVDRVLNCGFWVVVTTVEPAPLPRRRGRGPSSSLLLQLLL